MITNGSVKNIFQGFVFSKYLYVLIDLNDDVIDTYYSAPVLIYLLVGSNLARHLVRICTLLSLFH